MAWVNAPQLKKFNVLQFKKDNALRITFLIGLAERLAEATTTLLHRAGIKLHPPSVPERVRVDPVNCVVSVDNGRFPMKPDEVTLVKFLVEANGEVVSGSDIARQLGVQEFKASRMRKGIVKKYPELESIIVKSTDKKKRGFLIRLPPIE